MNEVGVEIVKSEETKESEIKYLNINVSNSEVERNPDIVRLCADVGILEYVKPKIGHWIYEDVLYSRCSECGELAIIANWAKVLSDFCPCCGAKMIEPQESEEV